MKVAIVGAGFTGLSAAYRLSQQNHQVVVFEKEKSAGGLADTFRLPGWLWPLEKHYHHWFTNDHYALGLIKELNLAEKLIFPNSLTAIYYQERIFPFNLPSHILAFSPLSVIDRIRTGLASLYLKLLPEKLALGLEKRSAYQELKRLYGREAFEIVWKPLLVGKFGEFASKVNCAWFWARIKKRTFRLGYLEGGYQTLTSALVDKIQSHNGKILLHAPFNPKTRSSFDKLIVTTPSPVFCDMFPDLPEDYKKRLSSIPHLHALNLIFITKEKFLKDVYWLNINDRNFPFIAVVQQTNLVSEKYYGGQHITWVGNYLPSGHPYLKMSKEKLFQTYLPYLKRINPRFNFQFSIINYQLFFGPFAQPVFPVNYSKQKPGFQTPLTNTFLANMDMVYPWDRGTNYAIELGYKVADYITKS